MDVKIAFADDDRVPEIDLESKVTVVAVLSSPSFNAPAVVAPGSLTFGASRTENSLRSCHVRDLNHDGLPDLVCQFYTQQGNFAPGQTMAVLQGQRSLPVSESKLIDAYTVLSGRPAIFEVKSITETNERDQIRHALSQLYEYRFLHAVKDATLWIVFSQPPSSRWYIDYLTGDRDVCVLWVEDENVCGPSLAQFG